VCVGRWMETGSAWILCWTLTGPRGTSFKCVDCLASGCCVFVGLEGGHNDCVSRGVQAGYGYFKGTKEHCPPVIKVVVDLRPAVRSDNWVAKTFLPVRSIVVDIVSRSITSAPNFEPIPCTNAVSVWRHLRRDGPDEDSPVVESRRVPYRRIGMAVLNPSKLTLLQRGLLFKVRRRQRVAGGAGQLVARVPSANACPVCCACFARSALGGGQPLGGTRPCGCTCAVLCGGQLKARPFTALPDSVGVLAAVMKYVKLGVAGTCTCPGVSSPWECGGQCRVAPLCWLQVVRGRRWRRI
jgi:hypothetical protein